MTRRLLIIIGLLCLFSVVHAQEDTLPDIRADDIFSDAVTILDEIDSADIPDPYALFSQDGSWRIRNTSDGSFLCQIGTDNCSSALPMLDVSTEILESGLLCDPYWLEDGLISQSLDENWILFSACANSHNQHRLDFYSYNISTNEVTFIDSHFYGFQNFGFYMEVVGWLDNYTPLLLTGELRTGSGHGLNKLDLRYEDSYEGLARQWAYQPYYSSDLNTVYWSEQYFEPAVHELQAIGWQIMERNLLTDEIMPVAEYVYEEPRPSDRSVGHVIEANENWIVVADSYPLDFQTPVYFYDRETNELRFMYPNLPLTLKSWDIALIDAGLWLWEYDLESTTTNWLLKRVSIESENIDETIVAESNEWAIRELYISDNEDYLLLIQDGVSEIYDIADNVYYPITQETLSLHDYELEVIWQPDNTLFVDVVRSYQIIKRWHIQIDAISESDT